MIDQGRFLLPLCLDDVPAGLVRALAQEGVPYCHRRKTASGCRFVLFDARRNPLPAVEPGQIAIDIDPIRDEMNGDPFEAMMSERSHRHCWRIAGLSVAEEIAEVDRRAIRRQMLGLLREMVESRGGVWLNVSPFPFPYRSALNVRIDYDQYDAEDFRTTLDTIAGHEEATTHFVNAAAYLQQDEALARLAGLDVGSHGYYHHTYRTEKENLTNVTRGIEVLRVLGIEPSGFAAPGGRFNRGLLRAMQTLGIGHSSEFALAHDDCPFFLEGDSPQNDLLQIPIHPISLGIFLEVVSGEGARRIAGQQQAVRAAIDHFRQTARAKYHAGEPVFFYGHPTQRLGRYPQVLRAIFDTADEFGAIWKTTLSRFAAWWRVRRKVQLCVVHRGDALHITAEGLPGDYRLAVEYWRGRHVARLPLDRALTRLVPSALAYENRTARPLVHPVRIDRAEGLRGHVRRLIDWEHETPTDEIEITSWRNWAKRTLRKIQQHR